MSFENRDGWSPDKQWWDIVNLNRWEIAKKRQQIRGNVGELKEGSDYELALKKAARAFEADHTDTRTKTLDADLTKISGTITEPLFKIGEVVNVPVEEVLQDKYGRALSKAVDQKDMADATPDQANEMLREEWVVIDPKPDRLGRIGVTKSFRQKHAGTATSAGIIISVSEVGVAHEEFMKQKAEKEKER